MPKYLLRGLAVVGAAAVALNFTGQDDIENNANVCEKDKDSGALVIKDAQGKLLASLHDRETVEGNIVSGNGILYDKNDPSKGIFTGVTFKGDFEKGVCSGEVLGDQLGSATVKAKMAPGTIYSTDLTYK